MKKVLKLMLLTLVSAICITGCGNSNVQNNNSSENTDKSVAEIEDEGNIKVYASICPLYDFAKEIAKDRADVELVIPIGQEPHDYEPENNEIQALENADVFIYNGAGLESWTDKVIKSLDNDGLVTIEASKGVNLLEDEEGTDPHTWLDPTNAVIEAQNICEGLKKADSENAEFYEMNFKALRSELEDLDVAYTETLKDTAKKDIIVSHEAFGYLCNAYGLNQKGIKGLNAESEPDAKTMANIIDFVRENDIKVIYTEDIIDTKVADTIAAETGAKTIFLNPIESFTDEEIENNDSYITIMQKNLKNLEEGLK